MEIRAGLLIARLVMVNLSLKYFYLQREDWASKIEGNGYISNKKGKDPMS